MANSARKNGKLALDRRIPVNPRYAGVESVYDTGPTVNKIKVVSAAEHLKRRDEAFYRLSPQQLRELLQEYETDETAAAGMPTPSLGLTLEGLTLLDPADSGCTGDGDSCGPRVVQYDPEDEPSYERPYLILDVRSPQDFADCHICQARSFPAQLLNQDKTTPELFSFKNKEASLVVVYDDGSERAAAQAATRLCLRGYGNIYLLTRGLAAFAESGLANGHRSSGCGRIIVAPSFVEGIPPPPPPGYRSATAAAGSGLKTPLAGRSSRGAASTVGSSGGARSGRTTRSGGHDAPHSGGSGELPGRHSRSPLGLGLTAAATPSGGCASSRSGGDGLAGKYRSSAGSRRSDAGSVVSSSRRIAAGTAVAGGGRGRALGRGSSLALADAEDFGIGQPRRGSGAGAGGGSRGAGHPQRDGYVDHDTAPQQLSLAAVSQMRRQWGDKASDAAPAAVTGSGQRRRQERDSETVRTELTVAESVISRAARQKGRF